MNRQSLAVVLGSLAALALGACTVGTTSSTGTGGTTTATSTGDATTSTTGGTGGAGGDATTTTTTTGTTATGTSTGTAMCDPTYTCVQAIAAGSGDPAELCGGPALDQFNALADCTCNGNCAAACKTNACTQQDPSAECKACLSTPDTGCKKEFDSCVSG